MKSISNVGFEGAKMESIEVGQLVQEASHLSFKSNSSLDLLRSQIIWSPNGTGKTSVVKALMSKRSLPITFADLEASRNDFVKNGKRLEIGLGIRGVEELIQANEDILRDFDVKKCLKDAGISNQAKARRFLPNYPRCTTDLEATLLSFQMKAAQELIKSLDSEDMEFYVSHRAALNDLSSLDQDIKGLKDLLINRALNELQHALDEDTHVCPVCGNETETPIILLIQERTNNYEAIQESLASEYANLHLEYSADEIREKIISMSEIRANDVQVLSYCLCRGDKSRCAQLSKNRTLYEKNIKEIWRLSNENEKFFESLLKREAELRSLFVSRFKAIAVELDRDSKHLVISLPRSVSTYSTGEVNLMLTLVRINEFLSSDNEAMVFDDPLSSLDKANQYLVMFELMRAGNSKAKEGKPITIFTHNMDCISIAESQHRNCFSYLCMERVGDELIVNEIGKGFFKNLEDAAEGEKLEADASEGVDDRNVFVAPGSLSAEAIIAYCEQHPSEATIPLLPYIQLVSSRDHRGDSDAHSVFHYRGSFTHPSLGLGNDFLVGSIDGFDASCISLTSFADRAIQKMFLIVALRVWIEKQLYIYYPELFVAGSERKTLGKLIKEAFDRGKWRGKGNVTRGFLNSKKTMLNQNAHYKAQSSPFDFAINLSIADICSEIKEIKEMFESG